MRTAALAFITCALSLTAHAQTTLKDELQLRYRAFNKAIQTKDTAFLETYFAPDFVAELPGSQSDRAQSIKGLGDLMRDAKHLNWTWDLSDLKLLPEGPTVTANGVLTARAKGPDNKWHQVKVAGTAEDTWTLNQNVWQLRRMRMLKLAAWMDGKPLPTPGSPFAPKKP